MTRAIVRVVVCLLGGVLGCGNGADRGAIEIERTSEALRVDSGHA